MKVFSWSDVVSDAKPSGFTFGTGSALTIGGFDGPHKGHCCLFDKVLEYKKNNAGMRAGVITFSKSPRSFKDHGRFSGDLTTPRMKCDFLEAYGFDFCIMIDFSYDFSKIKGNDFLDMIRKFCSMQFLTVGSDFRCGHNLDTGVAELSDYMTSNGLEFRVLDAVLAGNQRISSSLIRKTVSEGLIDYANELLGHRYCIDVSSFFWTFLKKGLESQDSSLVSSLFIADRSGTQIMPPSGSYTVSVTFAGEDSCGCPGFYEDCCGMLYVEPDFLRLEVPLERECTSLSVEKIFFIS